MHPNDNDPVNRAQAQPNVNETAGQVKPNTLSEGVIVSSPPREGFLTGSFVWMFIGVLLSGVAAWFVATNETLLQTVADSWFILFIGQIALVLGIMYVIPRVPAAVSLGLFFVYALTMGLFLGVIVYSFTYDPAAPGNLSQSGVSGVVSAFLGASAVFGGAAVYGYVTKRDLTSIGGIAVMGLLGLLVVMIVQLFLFPGNSMMNLLIGIVGVVIFTGLTAWDVQRLKEGKLPNVNKDSATVMGALMLYLDFINLFLFMLRIFGSSR